MILLWSIVSALALAWFAGDAVLGLLVAPRLFHHAAESGIPAAFPGLVFGDLLGRWVTFAGILLVVPMVVMMSAAAGRLLKQRGWRAAIMPLLAVALVLTAHVASATVVKEGRETAAALRADPNPDPELAQRFRGEFHDRSRLVFGAEMLVALAVAAMAAVSAGRQHRPGQRLG